MKTKALGIRNSRQIVDGDKSDVKHNLNMIQITEEDYINSVNATTKICQFISDIQLYKIILLNYQDYYNKIEYYKNLDYQQLMSLIHAGIPNLDINRVLLNLLSSVRMYLDHTELIINRRYGDASPRFTNFKRACSDAYDGQFSYRFLYKLRNYAQHLGLPLSVFSISSREHPERLGEPYHELSFGLNRDLALSDFDWGKQLSEELRLQPEIIEVAQHVPPFILSITQINFTFAQDESSNLLNEALYIKNLTDSAGYKETDTEIGIYEFEVGKNEFGKTTFLSLKGDRIPMEVVRAILNNDLVWLLAP